MDFSKLLLWILVIAVTATFRFVSGDGILEIQLVSFQNSLGTTLAGDTCDSDGSPCDTWFSVCLSELPVPNSNNCSRGQADTRVLGGNRIDFSAGQDLGNGFSNPLMFGFTKEWPGQFALLIDANDEDEASSQVIDSYEESIQLEPGTSQVAAPWKNWNLAGKGTTTFSLQLKLYCAENFFDRHCNTFCRAESDDTFYCEYGTGNKICKLGWTGPDCTTPVCKTGCHPTHGSCDQPTECQCEQFWTGEFCSECVPLAGCEHGACSEGNDCICEDDSWTGELCNIDLDSCRSSPCENNGFCANTGENAYTCNCLNGYIGDRCKIDYDECSSSPCLNHGDCVDLVGEFACECQPGFQGDNCEIEINHCFTESADGVQVPTGVCGDHGDCINSANGFLCQCQTGFDGKYCENNIDDCQFDSLCWYGECVDGVNAYTCECYPGWQGDFCNVDVNECDSEPCKNGGTCENKVADYQCSCPTGYIGKDCSIAAPEPCVIGNVTLEHLTMWDEDCNLCMCDNAQIKCTKVWCGPENCLATGDTAASRVGSQCVGEDSVCTPFPKENCIQGKCQSFGACADERTSQLDARCGSSAQDQVEEYSCSYVGMKIDLKILPNNTSVEDVCHELRHIRDLRQFAWEDALFILCERERAEKNVIYVSLESLGGQDTTTSALDEMTKYIKTLPRTSGNKILLSISDIFIPHSNSNSILNDDTLFIVTVVVSIMGAGLLLLAIFFAVLCHRRRKQKQKYTDHPLSRLTLKMQENPFFEEKDDVLSYKTAMYQPVATSDSSFIKRKEYELEEVSLSSGTSTLTSTLTAGGTLPVQTPRGPPTPEEGMEDNPLLLAKKPVEEDREGGRKESARVSAGESDYLAMEAAAAAAAERSGLGLEAEDDSGYENSGEVRVIITENYDYDSVAEAATDVGVGGQQ